MLVAFVLAVVLFGQHEDGDTVLVGIRFGDFADLDLVHGLHKSIALGLGNKLSHHAASLLGGLVVAVHGGELGKSSLLGTHLGGKALQHHLGVFDFLLGLALGVNHDAGTANGIVNGNFSLVEFPESFLLLFGRILRIRDLLFENLFALQLVFDFFLELGHGGVRLFEFLLESVFARELGLEELGQAVDLTLRDLDTHLLGFELDEFLANQVVNHGVTKLSHGLVINLLAAELLFTEHLGKAINLTGRNTDLFDANHVQALGIQQLSRGDTGGQSDRQDTARNKFKRTHFYSFLKFSGVNIEKVCEVSPAWANLFAHIAEPKPRTP